MMGMYILQVDMLHIKTALDFHPLVRLLPGSPTSSCACAGVCLPFARPSACLSVSLSFVSVSVCRAVSSDSTIYMFISRNVETAYQHVRESCMLVAISQEERLSACAFLGDVGPTPL